MIAILTGLAAGGLHVFSGVDHLAALAPIAVEEPRNALRTGAFWGLGHGLGVVLVGAVGLWLRSFLEIEAWSAWAEFGVGILLVGVGTWAVLRARRTRLHAHEHEHAESTHAHLHSHRAGRRRHTHAAMGVGLFHGVAGSGHLFGVVPALALATPEALLYLAAYLAAAVAAMSLFAAILGAVALRGGSSSIAGLMYGSGLVAMVVGLVWMITAWPL